MLLLCVLQFVVVLSGGLALADTPPVMAVKTDVLSVWDGRLLYVGKVWAAVGSVGQVGGKRGPLNAGRIIPDPQKDRAALGIDWIPSFEFPPGTQNDYLYEASIAFGCIHGSDTLVSKVEDYFGEASVELHSYSRIQESSARRSSPYYSPDARSEQQYYSVCFDTFVEPDTPDWIENRLHKPIGLEIHQTSNAWSDGFANGFIIVDYWIKNIGPAPISEGAVGFVVDPAVLSDRSPHGFRTIVGFLPVVSGIIGGSADTVNIGWAANQSGDPGEDGAFQPYSVRGVLGVRVLRAPPGSRLSFNWWSWDGDGDWGPRRWENAGGYAGSLGTPYGDRSRYKMMTNGEIDYDQVFTAIDYTGEGWSRPPSEPAVARGIASGVGRSLFLLSFGPLPDLAPGDSIPLTVALIAGGDFHTDPRNFAERFDPADPKPYLDHLNFSDLITKARWADWVFDNPGVDTDHDGNRGRAYLADCDGIDTVGYDTTISGNPPETTIVPITAATGCDSVFYKGDGIPDWRGPQAPPPPEFQLSSQPGRVTLRWTGAFSEIEVDPLSRKRDFEGYRVYAGRFAVDDQLSLIASWDKEDYKRFAYRPATDEWMQISDPLSTAEWKRLLNDAAFDPTRYAVPSPQEAYRDSFWDTTRGAQGETIDVAWRERLSYWATEAINRGNEYMENGRPENNLIQRVGQRDTIVNNVQMSYGVYEITIDNLQSSVPLFFAVSTFDFGDYTKNLDPMESAPANNSRYGHPIYSADIVIDSELTVGVYPNPYKISYDDAFGNPTTYYAEGYEGRGRPEFTEHDRRIHFINLPDTARIRIYSLDGDLIREINHPNKFLTTYSSSVGWDLISRNAQAVISGIYIYRVDSRLGTQVGKIVIIK